MVSGYQLVDGLVDRRIDQSWLGVFDCKRPTAVGEEVDLAGSVEGCGRTCWIMFEGENCLETL